MNAPESGSIMPFHCCGNHLTPLLTTLQIFKDNQTLSWKPAIAIVGHMPGAPAEFHEIPGNTHYPWNYQSEITEIPRNNQNSLFDQRDYRYS